MLSDLAATMHRVGAEILRIREQGGANGEWQGTQFKALADVRAHQLLQAELSRILDIPVVSEEDAASHSDTRPDEYWLVDPIDGTASYAQGFSGFVTQAALMQGGLPWMSAVFAPALDQLYLAQRGQGATLNGESMHLGPLDRKSLSLVDNYPQARGIAAHLYMELGCVQYIESGSIGLKICRVADGVADVFVKDVTVRDWDIAAPHLVLTESGGTLTGYRGENFNYNGNFEKIGLIAVSSASLLPEIGTAISRFGRAPG